MTQNEMMTAGPLQVTLHLNSGEAAWLERASGGGSAQAIIRALIALAAEDQSLRQAAQKYAAIGHVTPPLHVPGRQRGLSARDYQDALNTAGSMGGAARALGVHRTVVQEMVRTHNLTVPKARRTRKAP